MKPFPTSHLPCYTPVATRIRARFLIFGLALLGLHGLVCAPARAVAYGTNLLANANAEAGPNSPTGAGVAVPNWTTTTGFTVVPYDAPGGTTGYPKTTDPGPPNRGVQFFGGGNVVTSTATQDIDVSANAAAINKGAVGYDLSGWLGGYLTDGDSAKVEVTFSDINGNPLAGIGTIGPVTAAQRGNTTGLLRRAVTGLVPVNTTRIRVQMIMSRATGASNDGYADSLSLLLLAPYTVLNANDGGPGSLRAAIAYADANPGTTIRFASNVTGPITLTSGELAITKNTTVTGPAAGIIVQRGGAANFRIFNVNSGATVSISNLTMKSGRVVGGVGGTGGGTDANGGPGSAAQGGGILNNGILTLRNCTLSGNAATGGSGGNSFSYDCGDGRGVRWVGTGGTGGAGQGGGIFNGNRLTLINCTLSGNPATGGIGGGGSGGGSGGIGSGGGVFNQGTLTATNCTLSGNSANGGGGNLGDYAALAGAATAAVSSTRAR